MSRSHKRTPCFSCIGYFSNKNCKRMANRRMRSINRQIINSYMTPIKMIDIVPEDEPDDDGIVYDWAIEEYYPVEDLTNSDFKILREVSDTYSFDSDGLPAYDYFNDSWSIYHIHDPKYLEMIEKRMRK